MMTSQAVSCHLNYIRLTRKSSTTETTKTKTEHYGPAILILTTVPPPVFPSNVKKFASGASLAPNAFKISCANRPPTTAHTGENSAKVVVAIVLPARKKALEYFRDGGWVGR